MYFAQTDFICLFFPAFLFIYLFTGTAYRKYVLALASIVFVGIGGVSCLCQVTALLILNYVLLRLQYSLRGLKALLMLWVCVVLDVALLFAARASGIVVFAGLSFMVFRLISLQVDLYRRTVRKCPGFVDFLCYAALFITINAGPVTRYNEISGSISRPKVSIRGIDRGFRLFTVGLSFKVLLADRISFLWTEILSPGVSTLSVPMAWLGAFAASSQIYYDFLGYSLMATGLGIMTGIAVPDNFNVPYAAGSISDFYRRWHMTLGRWFRDYVYILLGGNRRGHARTVINVMFVWFLTAIWHGSTPNFLLWGLTLGILVSFEKLPVMKKLRGHKIVSVILHILVFMIILVSWCIFKNEDTEVMLSYLGGLFGLRSAGGVHSTTQQVLRYLKDYCMVLLPCALFMTPFPKRLWDRYSDSVIVAILLVPLFWLSFHQIVLGNSGDFIYMRY